MKKAITLKIEFVLHANTTEDEFHAIYDNIINDMKSLPALDERINDINVASSLEGM